MKYGFDSRRLHQFMLTLNVHPPIVDKDKYTISIWDDEKNGYETHSFEFIEFLHALVVYPPGVEKASEAA